MNLTDLIGKDDLIALQNELRDAFGLNADIMDAEGKKVVGHTWGNELCSTIRDDAKGFGSICAPAGQMFHHVLSTTKEPIAEFCDGGMMRVAVPVLHDGEYIGAVGGCGLAPDDDEVDTFTIGMMSDLDEAVLTEKAKTVAVGSQDKIKEIQSYITRRVEELIG
ncbi:transcriptional regulator [Pseudodesulfovibrio sp. JC047]|uniref:PocR ligand-binding domain-containing protein n=1 Tax=Pseudodesulfovibrio sp. JC047 TaxID=2683199 RepID=UPI0013D11282|nr:PocR ligand-binding domain-containing protein [Pseudodesulfovibrio sp. JC047]NDV18842.1 transcriptional regulator [Pseudodesulfovibrio sp. JC047]